MITLLIAEAAPADFKAWIESLAWLVGLIGGVLLIIKQLKPAKIEQPLEVKAHNTPATQGDIDQLHGRIKRERIEIDAKIADLKAEDLRLREKLDGDIEKIHDRIDKLPERVITTLREAKSLAE